MENCINYIILFYNSLCILHENLWNRRKITLFINSHINIKFIYIYTMDNRLCVFKLIITYYQLKTQKDTNGCWNLKLTMLKLNEVFGETNLFA